MIKHPKGNVLFDTGNNDKLITDPSYWGRGLRWPEAGDHARRRDRRPAKKIGLTPDDINYVVLSHLHLDHGGNVGKFPNSTIVVQKDEIQNAFWPASPAPAARTSSATSCRCARPIGNHPNASKMIQLDGDLDLFGDGTSWSSAGSRTRPAAR